MPVNLGVIMTIIRIGHSAYNGTNALRYCFSKAQAVRVLCNRGLPRNKARLAIKTLKTHACLHINYAICELADMTDILNNPDLRKQYGYYMTPQELKTSWKNASE